MHTNDINIRNKITEFVVFDRLNEIFVTLIVFVVVILIRYGILFTSWENQHNAHGQSPIYRLQGTETQSNVFPLFVLLEGDVMKGLASAMFWTNQNVYTKDFAYNVYYGR